MQGSVDSESIPEVTVEPKLPARSEGEACNSETAQIGAKTNVTDGAEDQVEVFSDANIATTEVQDEQSSAAEGKESRPGAQN